MSTTTLHRILRASAVAAALVAVGPAAPASGRPLQTALTNPTEPAFAEADPDGALAAARGAGFDVIRIPIAWSGVAPYNSPDAANPGDQYYRWGPTDERIQRTLAAGMEPLLSVYSAPVWGRVRGRSPDPAAFATFMGALARRYSGDFEGRPRVRLFQLWNEPNLHTYLDPSDAPDRYRAMVTAAYPAIKAVHPDNFVVAGGTAPFAGENGKYGMGPFPFMRAMLREKTPFDAWAHHPYTSGNPSRKAVNEGDASIGDLPELRRILRSTGHGAAQLWVTEFSYDSAPPDPFAVPVHEHARWVSESLYRMWAQGVTLVTWFQLRDNPQGTFHWGATYQSGLYFRTTDRYADEKAKPALRSIRFPFVALPSGSAVKLWG
ncbi:MAG TPA: cellulase family glycosylhydrolase, partial [Solirubrobacteraceae bacterium]|nr:cellulase family glycosylhydrolase [Solirubrobacteraceae bacterium]